MRSSWSAKLQREETYRIIIISLNNRFYWEWRCIKLRLFISALHLHHYIRSGEGMFILIKLTLSSFESFFIWINFQIVFMVPWSAITQITTNGIKVTFKLVCLDLAAQSVTERRSALWPSPPFCALIQNCLKLMPSTLFIISSSSMSPTHCKCGIVRYIALFTTRSLASAPRLLPYLLLRGIRMEPWWSFRYY